MRILESTDGAAWASAALLSENDIDLRDPKLSLTLDKKLMLLMGGTYARAAAADNGNRASLSHRTGSSGAGRSPSFPKETGCGG